MKINFKFKMKPMNMNLIIAILEILDFLKDFKFLMMPKYGLCIKEMFQWQVIF